MARKIQNEDIKSSTELIAAGGTAAQLPNDDKVYVTANSLNKTLKQAIIDGDIGGGVASPSIFGLLNVDDDGPTPLANWTTSGGTLSIESVNHLNGEESFKFSPSTVNDETKSPSITIPKRTLDNAGKSPIMVSFAYNATNDGFRAIIKDNSSNELGFVDLDSTKKRVQILVNLTGSETSLSLTIKDQTHTASMNIIFDDIVFDDEPFRKIDTIAQQFSETPYSSTLVSGTGTNIRFNATVNGDTQDIVSIFDNGTNTVFKAKRDCYITLTVRFVTGFADNIVRFLYNDVVDEVSSVGDDGSEDYQLETYVKKLSSGDEIKVQTSASLRLSSGNFKLIATAVNESVALNIDSTPFIEVKTTTSQSMAHDTIQKLTFTSPTYTNGVQGAWDSSNNKYVAQTDGWYDVSINSYKPQIGTAEYLLAQHLLYKNGSAIEKDGTEHTGSVGRNNPAITSNFTVYLAKNDYIELYGQFSRNDGGATSLDAKKLSIQLKNQGTAHIMDIADPYENVYSVRVSSGGSITSQSGGGWLSSVTKLGTGSYRLNLVSGFFSVSPSAVVSTGANIDSRVAAVSTTAIDIVTQFDTTNGDSDFSVVIQRQGADYREPKGYFIGQSVPMRTAYLEMNNYGSNWHGAGSTTSYKAYSFTGVSGDSFVSVSGTNITLQAGKYEFSYGVAGNGNTQWLYSDIYSVTDAAQIQEFPNCSYNELAQSVSFNTIFATIELTSTKVIQIRTRSTLAGSGETISRPKITKVK